VPYLLQVRHRSGLFALCVRLLAARPEGPLSAIWPLCGNCAYLICCSLPKLCFAYVCRPSGDAVENLVCYTFLLAVQVILAVSPRARTTCSAVLAGSPATRCDRAIASWAAPRSNGRAGPAQQDSYRPRTLSASSRRMSM
jgi:hypothetical protein